MAQTPFFGVMSTRPPRTPTKSVCCMARCEVESAVGFLSRFLKYDDLFRLSNPASTCLKTEYHMPALNQENVLREGCRPDKRRLSVRSTLHRCSRMLQHWLWPMHRAAPSSPVYANGPKSKRGGGDLGNLRLLPGPFLGDEWIWAVCGSAHLSGSIRSLALLCIVIFRASPHYSLRRG